MTRKTPIPIAPHQRIILTGIVTALTVHQSTLTPIAGELGGNIANAEKAIARAMTLINARLNPGERP